jgi:hypothetical protein
MANRNFALIVAALTLTAACSKLSAAPTSVATEADLAAALAAAKGGETIHLAAGTYAVALSEKAYASPVTLTSQNPDKPAQIADLSLDRVKNLTIREIQLGRPLRANEPNWSRFVRVGESQNIVFDKVDVHGSLDENPQNDGTGMFITGSKGVSVTNSEFQQLFTAILFTRSSDLRMSGNHFHDLESDGSDFSAVTNVKIDGNCFTSFFPAKGDHPDGIQFWNNSVPTGSANVLITDNQVFQGRGAGMQGIFIGSEEPTKRHRDITIVNNLIYVQDQYNGIAVADTDRVTIERNTVISIPDDKPLWIALWSDTAAQVIGNVSDKLINQKSEIVKLDNNLFLDQSRGKFRNIKAGVDAVASDFVMADRGYQGGDMQCQKAPTTR